MSIKTTTKFLEDVKRNVIMPPSQRLLTSADILSMASSIVESELVPLLLAARQGYLEATYSVSLVADQNVYELPPRSISRGLKDVKWYSPDRSSVHDLVLLDQEYSNLYETTGDYPKGFYFQADDIVVVPKPVSAYGCLEYKYHLAPNDLCLTADAAMVDTVAGDAVSVVAAPSAFAATTQIDFIKGRPGYTTLGMDAEIANVAGNILTFNSGVVPTTLKKGDYLAIAGTSPVVQAPDICYKYLLLKTAMEVAENLSDLENSDKIREKLIPPVRKELEVALEPRISDEVKKIINPYGLLRGRFRRFRF